MRITTTYYFLLLCVALSVGSVSIALAQEPISEFSLVEKRPDGTEVYLHIDGRTNTLRYTDGRLEQQYLSGRPHIVTYPDGRIVYYSEEGEIIGESLPDGRDRHFNEQGEVTEEVRRTDTVTESIRYEDGEPVTVQRESSLATVFVEPNGNRVVNDGELGVKAIVARTGQVIELQQTYENFTYRITKNPATEETLTTYSKEGEVVYARGMRNGESVKEGRWYTGLFYSIKRRFSDKERIELEVVTDRYAEVLSSIGQN